MRYLKKKYAGVASLKNIIEKKLYSLLWTIIYINDLEVSIILSETDDWFFFLENNLLKLRNIVEYVSLFVHFLYYLINQIKMHLNSLLKEELMDI